MFCIYQDRVPGRTVVRTIFVSSIRVLKYVPIPYNIRVSYHAIRFIGCR